MYLSPERTKNEPSWVGVLLLVILPLAGCGENKNDTWRSELERPGVVAMVSAPVVAKVGEEIVLDASASSSKTGAPLSYRWSVLEEPGLDMFRIESGSEAVTVAVASMEGVYRLELKVSDGSASDTIDYELFVKDDGVPVDAASTDNTGECVYENEYAGFVAEME